MSEYERHQTRSSDRTRLRWLTLAGYGLAAFIATCVIINLTIGLHLWRPDLGAYSQSLEQMTANADKVDTVFVGSSHFAWGIDPPLFDDAVVAAGGNSTSHLLSTAGLSFPWITQAISDLGAIPFDDLRFVVVEPRLHVTPVRRLKTDIFGNAFSQRSRYINNIGKIGEPLNMLAAIDLPPEQKLPLYAELGYGVVASASNIGVLRDLFLPPPESAGELEVTWENRGGQSGTRTISGKQFDRAIDTNQNARQISAYEKQALERVIENIEALGATPLFLLPPSRMDTGLQGATRDALLTLVKEDQLLDYTYPVDGSAGNAGIYAQQDLWLDPEHLNVKGSAEFSAELGRIWADIFRQVAPVN